MPGRAGIDANAGSPIIIAMITSAQLRAARALLGLDIDAIAALAGVIPSSVSTAENGQLHDADILRRLHDALEEKGVEFLPNDDSADDGADGGIGVRLRQAGEADEGLRPEQLNAANDG